MLRYNLNGGSINFERRNGTFSLVSQDACDRAGPGADFEHSLALPH